MAKQQVLVSDLSGEAITDDASAVKVVVTTTNGKRFELDAQLSEVESLIANARETKKRGRPAKKS